MVPASSCRVASMRTRAMSASGAAPPNMPECMALRSERTVTTTLAIPRRVVVRVGSPVAKLPPSADGDGRRRGGGRRCSATTVVQSGRALLLGAFGDELEVDRERAAAERAQRGEVGDEAALVVGGATAVPAAVVARGQRERRRLPGVLAQRRLHVVVAVQEHRGRALGARGGAEHGRVAVGGLELADAVQAGVVEQARRSAARPSGTPRAGTGARRPRTGWPRGARGPPACGA